MARVRARTPGGEKWGTPSTVALIGSFHGEVALPRKLSSMAASADNLWTQATIGGLRRFWIFFSVARSHPRE